MRRILVILALLSVPLLMMLQVFQAYKYAVAGEELAALEVAQRDRLEENKKLLAGIAVFDAPERIYQVAGRTLELDRPKPEDVLLVKFADGTEIVP